LKIVLGTILFCAASGCAHASCQGISASGLSFGTYTGATLANSAATVTVTCGSVGSTYSVGMNAGTAAGATVSTRKMKNGPNVLNYALYQNAARSINWGDTNGVNARAGTNNQPKPYVTVLNIYATLTSLQYPAPGAYTDTVTATQQTNTHVTTTYTVTAMVQATCTISATALNFGIYTGVLLNGISTITAQCTNTTPYRIGLSAGKAVGATAATRKMTGPNGALQSYGLFLDSAHSANWGITDADDSPSQTGNGRAQSITVYGQVPAGQALNTPGSYNDTIVATLTY
jgi:spore coat protein U-like protein